MASVQHIICDAKLFPHRVLEQQKAFQGVEKERHFAATRIQKTWRGYVVRKEIARWNFAATVLQKYIRRWLVKWHMCEVYRAYMDRYRVRYYNKMATRIQALWRGYFVRRHHAKDLFEKLRAEGESNRMQQLFGTAFSNMDNFKKEMLNEDAHRWVIYIIFKLHHLLRTFPKEGIYSSHNKKTLSSIEKLLKALPLKNYTTKVKRIYYNEMKKEPKPYPYMFKNKKFQATEDLYRNFNKNIKLRDVKEIDKNIHPKPFLLTTKLAEKKYERSMLLSSEEYPGPKFDLARLKEVKKQVTPRDFDLNLLKKYIGDLKPPCYYLDFWCKVCNEHNVPETVNEVRTRSESVVVKSMKQESIVPDILDVAPKEVVNVVYPNNVCVNFGNILTPTQVKCAPLVKWRANRSAFYTLCLTDPDAPSRKEPIYREWHHWLVGNIPGRNVSKGEILSEYIGSGPPPSTGLHRYVFLIYKQNRKLAFDDVPRLTNTSADNRGGFSIKKFAASHNLGNPIAGNFYQAEYDDYVPLLYKQLGF